MVQVGPLRKQISIYTARVGDKNRERWRWFAKQLLSYCYGVWTALQPMFYGLRPLCSVCGPALDRWWIIKCPANEGSTTTTKKSRLVTRKYLDRILVSWFSIFFLKSIFQYIERGLAAKIDSNDVKPTQSVDTCLNIDRVN